MLAACLWLALAGAARAQVEDGSGRVVYPASFFAPYSPSNAQQMIERVPGFVIDSGDSSVRGFAQAAGNVVINGQRPSSKSDTLQTVLARIPASRVLRIEVASGNQFGADYAGKPQVVNLILTDAGGLAGTAEARLSREFTGRVLPKANMSVVYRRGASSFSGSLSYQLYSATEEGFDRVTSLPSAAETEYRTKRSRNTEPYTVASLGWAMEQAPDRSAHVNGKLSWDKWTIQQPGQDYVSGVKARDERYTEDHLWRTWELSGDVTRPLAGGAIKLNALATHRHRRNDDAFSQTASTGSLGGFTQKFDDWRDERVGRLAWSHPSIAGWALEIGGEGAYNRLKTDLNLFNVDGTGARTRIDLPIDNAIVSEYRGEAFANAGRALSGNLHLDLGLTYEASRIKVTGDVAAERTLQFLKPKVSLDWTPGAWHAQLSVRRTVAQLQFEDFVSGASFSTNQQTSGNAALQPQRAWEVLASADRKLLGEGRIKLELGFNQIAMVQDRIPTPGGDAPGNLGDGQQRSAKINLDLPLKSFGIKGGRLSATGAYVATTVTDPYRFTDRRFSGSSSFTYTLGFRQDLGMFAWGLDLRGNTGATYYRRTETDFIQGISPRLAMFAEYRPTPRTTVTVGADNLSDALSKRLRTFYAPDRTTLVPSSQEYRERSIHPIFYLSVKHSFGA